LKQRLVILGAGGHGRVAADVAELHGYGHVEFADQQYPSLTKNLDWPIRGKTFSDISPPFAGFIAIGSNVIRLAELNLLLKSNIECPTLIHPSACVSRYAIIDAGTIVMANAVINAGARLGRGVIANTGCTIDHDCNIGDGAHISPGANIAGGVKVGQLSWIGIGACIIENIEIGSNAIIAAGSVVVSTVEDNQRVYGAPARPR
jgi:sugar O-acyltransferase (sialic acid O-acetyltransferase NeuD family)